MVAAPSGDGSHDDRASSLLNANGCHINTDTHPSLRAINVMLTHNGLLRHRLGSYCNTLWL